MIPNDPFVFRFWNLDVLNQKIRVNWLQIVTYSPNVLKCPEIAKAAPQFALKRFGEDPLVEVPNCANNARNFVKLPSMPGVDLARGLPLGAARNGPR